MKTDKEYFEDVGKIIKETVKKWTITVHNDTEYGETVFEVVDISDAEEIIRTFEAFGRDKYTYSLTKEE
jgi:HEPN domain-containing protein